MRDLKLGNSTITVEIFDYDIRNIVIDENKNSDKVVLMTRSIDGNQFNIDEVWIKQKDQPITRGLWITLDNDQNILATSTLGKFLKFLQINTLTELVGKKIVLTQKENQFMAAKAYNE